MAEPPVLIDSSIWIAGLSARAPQSLRTTLIALIEAKRAAVTEVIRLEVMAGARSEKHLADLRADFDALQCLTMTTPEWRKAEEIGFTLGRHGLAVASADLMIATVAVSYGVPLWHADRDFEHVRRIAMGLHTFWYPTHSPAISVV